MLRSQTRLGVVKLWRAFEPMRVPHKQGFSTLAARVPSAAAVPIVVGVDGSNLLHHLIRSTNSVDSFWLEDASHEEMARHAVSWARRAHRLLNSSGSGFTTREVGNRIVLTPTESGPGDASSAPSAHRVIFVFDGSSPPLKQSTRANRDRERMSILSDARFLALNGETAQARSLLSVAPTLRPAAVLAVARALRAAGFSVLVAPFEAEAQLAFMSAKRRAQSALTEGAVTFVWSGDSDLLAHGDVSVLRPSASSAAFDIYDLGNHLGLRPSSASASALDAAMLFAPPSPFAAAALCGGNDSRLDSTIAEQRRDATCADLQMLCRGASDEVRIFCCVASGCDFTGCQETLTGTALAIFRRILVFSQMQKRRRLPATVREAAEVLGLLHEGGALHRARLAAIARGVLAMLLHVVYDPATKSLTHLYSERAASAAGSNSNSYASLRQLISELDGDGGMVCDSQIVGSFSGGGGASAQERCEGDAFLLHRVESERQRNWTAQLHQIFYDTHHVRPPEHQRRSALGSIALQRGALSECSLAEADHGDDAGDEPEGEAVVGDKAHKPFNSSVSPPMSPFGCALCGVTGDSFDGMQKHFMGRRHQAKVKIAELLELQQSRGAQTVATQ